MQGTLAKNLLFVTLYKIKNGVGRTTSFEVILPTPSVCTQIGCFPRPEGLGRDRLRGAHLLEERLDRRIELIDGRLGDHGRLVVHVADCRHRVVRVPDDVLEALGQLGRRRERVEAHHRVVLRDREDLTVAHPLDLEGHERGPDPVLVLRRQIHLDQRALLELLHGQRDLDRLAPHEGLHVIRDEPVPLVLVHREERDAPVAEHAVAQRGTEVDLAVVQGDLGEVVRVEGVEPTTRVDAEQDERVALRAQERAVVERRVHEGAQVRPNVRSVALVATDGGEEGLPRRRLQPDQAVDGLELADEPEVGRGHPTRGPADVPQEALRQLVRRRDHDAEDVAVHPGRDELVDRVADVADVREDLGDDAERVADEGRGRPVLPDVGVVVPVGDLLNVLRAQELDRRHLGHLGQAQDHLLTDVVVVIHDDLAQDAGDVELLLSLEGVLSLHVNVPPHFLWSRHCY